jgi:hypothetical protein
MLKMKIPYCPIQPPYPLLHDLSSTLAAAVLLAPFSLPTRCFLILGWFQRNSGYGSDCDWVSTIPLIWQPARLERY